MNWNIDKNRPICPQICEQLSLQISQGKFKPNEKLFSVRDVALKAGVNPNTVQKSFEKLEEIGLIYSKKGTGWFVSQNTETADKTVLMMKKKKIEDFLLDMGNIGVDKNEIIKLIMEENND